MKRWREELAALGYRFQFITLAGWHALNLSMFELAAAYGADGMLGYSQLQQREFGQEAPGLSRDQASGICRYRLLRRRADGDQREELHGRDGGQHRDRAIHARRRRRQSPQRVVA